MRSSYVSTFLSATCLSTWHLQETIYFLTALDLVLVTLNETLQYQQSLSLGSCPFLRSVLYTLSLCQRRGNITRKLWNSYRYRFRNNLFLCRCLQGWPRGGNHPTFLDCFPALRRLFGKLCADMILDPCERYGEPDHAQLCVFHPGRTSHRRCSKNTILKQSKTNNL